MNVGWIDIHILKYLLFSTENQKNFHLVDVSMLKNSLNLNKFKIFKIIFYKIRKLGMRRKCRSYDLKRLIFGVYMRKRTRWCKKIMGRHFFLFNFSVDPRELVHMLVFYTLSKEKIFKSLVMQFLFTLNATSK